MEKVRIGIVGYGNIGKGTQKAVQTAPDMELVGIFTRRDPKSLNITDSSVPVYSIHDADNMRDKIDVMILCGGSSTDLFEQGSHFAANFNIVDSFDIHAKIPEYLDNVNASIKNTTAVISSGWDPGLFSMMRLMTESILPDGATYTFWGHGVSQGHSFAIRNIDGVADAVQYTVPIDKAVEAVRSGEMPVFEARDKHLRRCFVVAEEGADLALIEHQIKTMPNYFADYDTTVNFITADELKKDHSTMPHGGMVMHSGTTGENKHIMEFSLKLDSNPEFTASVLVACARACYKMYKKNDFGAKTVFDIPLAYLSFKDYNSLVKELL